MILHHGTPWRGADEFLDVFDQCSWAKDQGYRSIHKGFTATRTSNNLSFLGDAERQCDKAGIKVRLSLPRASLFLTVS